MKRTIIIITSFLIIIGAIAVALNLTMGNQTVMFLQKTRLANGMFIYKFDFKSYVYNIATTVTDTSKLALNMPPQQWMNLTATNFGQALGNNLALILNYIIMFFNVLLYPFRIGGYFMKNIFSLIGINTDVNNQYNGLAWLINVVNFFIEDLQVPFVV